jgi:hypothetical protein
MLVAHRASLRAGRIGMLAGSIRLMLHSDTEAFIDWRRMTASIAPTCECIESTSLRDAHAITTVPGERCLPVMEQVSRH